jgi:hypothetical protein
MRSFRKLSPSGRRAAWRCRGGGRARPTWRVRLGEGRGRWPAWPGLQGRPRESYCRDLLADAVGDDVGVGRGETQRPAVDSSKTQVAKDDWREFWYSPGRESLWRPFLMKFECPAAVSIDTTKKDKSLSAAAAIRARSINGCGGTFMALMQNELPKDSLHRR